MKNQPPRHDAMIGEAVGPDNYDFNRRMDAVMGSRALLELQVRYHQYPCKIAGEAPADAIIEALGE